MRSEQAMTPQELAGEVAETVALAQSRITGIGADQYHEVATGRQKFEDMPLDALIEYAEEEALDLINYAVMARIRYARVRTAIAAWYRADRPAIVCLCGSTRFWRTFQEAGLRETLAGRIVLSIGAASGTDDGHFGDLPRDEYDRVKADLDTLHLKKIELADEVLILDCPGEDGQPYVGESTARELAHARALGKRIRFWSEENARS
jgi:hypothetical protein